MGAFTLIMRRSLSESLRAYNKMRDMVISLSVWLLDLVKMNQLRY
jgi:hypothetical protein